MRHPLNKMLTVKLILLMVTISLASAYLAFKSAVSTGIKPQACYFSGAGLYFWWQLGAAQYLKENCNYLEYPIMAGASAGSITSTLLLSGVELRSVPNVAIKLAMDSGVMKRKTGLAGVLGLLVRQWLEEVIPDDVDMNRFKNLQIALTPMVGSNMTPKLVSNFIDKDDLINAILASCHIPVFLDGKPYTNYRGEQVMDGSFWYFVTKNRINGMPLPKGVPTSKIFWVDYVDDEDFMQTVSGNFLEMISPDGLLDMVESGYNYMKREHYYGNLPYAKIEKPTFVKRVGEDVVSGIKKVPSQFLLRVASKIVARSEAVAV